ncbi:ankyrin-2 isoform X4 [Fopius arisanus]|uniref:Ankyrin-2 isoform X4 n=1 Tax=Fopius arisanus TaxID=64838 RepID=A0A9R1U225_9HYME|nr:PREDICTED: ankyrin-2-like isoform X4 [Fopius arisanus]
MTGVEEGKGSGGEGTDVSATDKLGQQNGAPEKAPVVAGTNMETLPRPGKQSDPSTAFLRAARAGQLEKVLEFLESGVDINASNANGLNALHLAAKDGHLEIVRELLTRGATVDAATKKGNTALHIASLAGQEEVVQLLVQKGASVNAQSQNGFTPLYMAAQENHDSVVKFLLSKGANQTLATEDGFTPLAVAMQQGHDKVVAVLLESDTRGKVRLPALHIAAKKDDCKAAALLLQNDHNPDVTSKSGFTPLHIAAHYGNDRIASLLYEKGADVNFAAKHNITPMHVAAKWGKIKMVNLLMSKGANISAKTRDGLTPLHCAARAGHHEVVDILIEKGAPIGSKTKNGLAPLHMASQGDHVDAARILLYHRAPVDEVTVDYLTALHVAAHCGHVRVAKLLLDRNADPNARALNGFTPLHIACKKNRIKVVELLLKHKASIEATTESGLTPLHVASFMGCMNIVIYLLQNEASPDIPTVRGETPLHLAARANQTDIIRILLRNGAQVDARAREEQTPLHVASRLGNVDIVMLLLQHGADVDATTKDLYTPLHIAAKEGQEEVASVLLENGASLTATTKKGFTPLHLAAKYGNMNVARLLLQKNAPVDAQGKNGVTPLHVASHYDHQNVALLLLDKGASPHAMAKNGHTPLHIAARKNQMDIATTLLEYGAKANAESKAGFTPLHLSAQEGHTDMSTLLIEHKADTNHKAKNGLTPLHLCAQEDKTNVATILVKNGAQIDAKTKAGYTPLHVACHFGQAAMVRFLLRNGAAVDSGTGAGYTPLHQAAQQGHTLIINLLLESKAQPNAITNNGQTALAIAQKLGYISVVETLKVVTETVITTTHTITIEEKYKVQAPESMQETFMSDSEDEGGGDEIGMAAMNVYGQPPHAQHVYLPSYYQGQMTYTREDPMLSDQQQYRYMTVDDMKSMGDDSMRVNVTDDEKDNRHSGGVSVTDMVTKETYQRTNAANLKPDNVDIHRHPVHVGIPQWRNFLVSFLVDARGGAMRGCRHSGVRVIVPPRKAAMPMRVTCRYLKRDKLTNPPPLMEGEALASRILELGPVGAKFLGPVIIEVPHFASLRGKEREIVILRSDNGETWREHTLEASEEAVQDVLNESFEGEELSQLEDLQTSRIVRILTVDFPHYFAVVSRIRQEVHAVGPEGGTVSSSAVPQVQAVFPPAALTKKIRVGLQAHPIPVELVAKLLGNRVAVSPIVTVEPRRRKFHKPITLTIPVPQAANKGMINQYSGETPTLRLLCSITGGQSRAVWEDVTGSTPLQFVKDCVSFTTTVSARFWLMDCRNVTEATRMATELYTHATHVPFMAKFVVFAKRVDPLEARLRVFCMTDDKEDKTLEHQEHFTEVAKSRDVEVLEGKTQYMEFAGNLVPVLKSGEQLQLPFRAFKENRVPFTARVKDPDAADMVGRIMFMSEPKVAKGEPPQTPICTLNILLPEKISPDAAHSELDLLELSKNYSFLRDGGITRPDTIHRATIRLTDIANLLDRDWEKLAEEINISPSDVELIKLEHPDKPALQAATMFKIWQANGNKATGNTLEKALNKIGREDIVKKCIFNVELVTDDVEKAVARVRLDQPGFDSLKEELGPSRDSSLRRDGTLADRKTDLDYEEPDRMRDSESIEDLRAVGNVPHKQTKPQHITINGTTVFNGTSTPIKDKYASDEKELVDEMADFLEHKCHKTDTMTKRIRDEADDDNRNRQKIIEDANRLVTGVLQDAEKEKEKLAKEGWSGVYDDSSKEAEGAVGQIEGIIVTESVGRGEESIEPLFIKKKKIETPHGTTITTVTTTTKGDPKSGTVISQTKTVKETITPGQVHLFETKQPVTVLQDNSNKKVTITKTIITLDSDHKDVEIPRRSDEPSAPMAAFDPNVEADRIMEPAQDIIRIQPDPVLMSTRDGSASEKDKLSKGSKDIAEKSMKNKLNDNVKDLKSGKPIKETEAGAYEGVYNVHLDDPKVEEGKKKEKGGIFSGIFKGPKAKKGKKRDSKEVSFDSGDEDIKATKDFLEDTRKVADLMRDSPQFEYPAFDPTTYICICPQKLPENEPNRDPIWATADFLYDSRRSAEAFVPEMEELADEQEIKPIDGVAITPEAEKTPEKKEETKEGPVGVDEHKEKHGFFSGLFKGSKKHDSEVDSPVLKTKKEGKNIIEKHEQEMEKSAAELKSNLRDGKHQADISVKKTIDEVDSAVTTTKKSVLDDIKDFKKTISDDKKQTDDRLKRLSTDLKSLDDKIKSGEDEIVKDTKHTAGVLEMDIKEANNEVKDKSGGFFGIFKSPKAKSRRSRSKDKDTSKDVSFDSGDEELRLTTAVFLDDTRKAADKVLLEMEKEPEVKDQSDVKIEKFIMTVPEESDLPKDKLSGSSYKIAVPKIETTTVITTSSSEQKLPYVDKKIKTEQRRSGEFSDSADEGKSKGTSFFEKFKSPKLRSRKKDRSQDRSTSTEPSFDSGDEELRNTTSKFLEDTRKIAEVTGSYVEPQKSVKDVVVSGKSPSPAKEVLETKPIHDQGLDMKSKDDDGRGKGGLFGIFKSPKTHIRKRSKSREKSSSTDASFDSGDEDLRIATSKLLDDTRKIADIMEENPYPSAPAIQSPEEVPVKEEDPEKLNEKSGFLSGIFKSAKHAVEEVTEDVKEFWDETKEETEVEKERAVHALEETTKVAAGVGDEITAIEESTKLVNDQKVEENLDKTIDNGQDVKNEIADVTDKTENITHQTVKGPRGLKGKVSKDAEKIKTSTVKPLKKEIDIKKGRSVDTKKSVDSPTAAKRKTGKELEKPKEKGPGLLSGIIKSAKHAVGEVSEDVKEFWDETKDEAQKEERAQKEAETDVRKASPVKDSDSSADEMNKKEKLPAKEGTGSIKGHKGKVMQTTTTTIKTTKTSPPKNGKAIDQAKKTTVQTVKEESKTVKRKVSDADKSVAAKTKLVKDSASEKAKVVKNVSEIPKTTKDTVGDKTKSADQSSAEKGKPTKGGVTETPKSDKTNGHEKIKPLRQSPSKIVGDIDHTKKGIPKQVKGETKLTKSKVDVSSKGAVVVKDPAPKKDKEIKKGKEKNFLTGIISDVESSPDNIAEHVNQFLEETRKDAEEQEKQLRRESEHIATSTVDTTGKMVQDIKAVKDDASREVTDEIKDMVDVIHKTKKEASSISDGVKSEIEKEIKPSHDSSNDITTTVIDSFDNAVKDGKKVKDKGKGFLFGIFKGSKHSTDESTDETQDAVDEIRKEGEKGAVTSTATDIKEKEDHDVNIVKTHIEKTRNSFDKGIEEAKRHITDKISGAAAMIEDDLHTTERQAQKELEQGKEIIDDALKETSEKIDDNISKTHIIGTTPETAGTTSHVIEDAVKQTAEKVTESKDTTLKKFNENLKLANEKIATTTEEISDSLKDGKEKMEKEAKKTKDKGKGFFTNIFKGSKHAVDDTTNSTQEFLEKTKAEVEKEKEQLQHDAEKATDNITDVKRELVKDFDATKDALVNQGIAVDDAISTTTKLISKTTGDTTKEVIDDILDTKHTVGEKMETNVEGLTKDVKEVFQSVTETSDESKMKIEKEEVKAKEKGKGFFSGIFKGAKHTSDEIVEDAKDLVHKGKVEFEKDKHEISERVADTTKAMSDVADKAEKKVVDTVIAGSDATEAVAQTTEKAVSRVTHQAGKATKDTVHKIIDGTTEAKDSISSTISKDTEKIKGEVKSVVNAAEENKEKIEIEVGKTKDKTKGFFTGIFKGSKHAVEEVVQDTKDLIDETEKQIKEEDVKLSLKMAESTTAVVDATKRGEDKVDDLTIRSKKALSDTAKPAGDVLTGTIEKTSEMSKDTVEKLFDSVADSKPKSTEKVKRETKDLKEDALSSTRAMVDSTEESKDKVEKEAAKAKEKTKGFFSGIFKGTKHAADEVIKDTKNFIHDAGKDVQHDTQTTDTARKTEEKVSDAAVLDEKSVANSIETAGDVISRTTEELSQISEDTKQKISDDVIKAEIAITEKVKKDLETLEGGVRDSVHTVTDNAEESKQKAGKEAAKAKTKSKGFFSGIFKGAKHAADDVVDDMKEFINETKQDAKTDEEQLSKHMSDSADNIKDAAGKVKDKMIVTARAGEDGLVDSAKVVGDTVSNTADKAKNLVVDTAIDGKDSVIDGAKAVGITVSSTAEKVRDGVVDTAMAGKEFVVDGAKVIAEATSSTADNAKDKIVDTIVAGKDSLVDGTKVVGETVSSATQKAKDKVIDTAIAGKDSVVDRVKAVGTTVSTTAEKTKDDVVDTVIAARKSVVDGTKAASDSVANFAEDTKDKFVDAAITGKEVTISGAKRVGNALLSSAEDTSEITKDSIERVSDYMVETKDAVTHKIAENAESVKDEMKDLVRAGTDSFQEGEEKIEKELTKGKDKTKGFLSGIFKSTKNASKEVAENAKKNVEKAENKLKEDKEKLPEEALQTKENITHAAVKVKRDIMDSSLTSKDAAVDIVKSTADALSSTCDQTFKTVEDTAKKISNDVTETSGSVLKKVHKDGKDVTSELKDAVAMTADIADESRDKLEIEALKTKEKSKGFFSEIFKGAKQAADEAGEDTKHFLDHTKKEIEEDREKLSKQMADTTKTVSDAVDKTQDKIMDTAVSSKDIAVVVADTVSDVLSSSVDHSSKTTKDAIEKVEEGVEDAKVSVGEAIKKDTKDLKDTIVETIEESNDKIEKETLKTKEKTKGFFSGIFKGAKHSAHEAIEGTKESVEHTQKVIEQDKEKLSKQASDIKTGLIDTAKKVTGERDNIAAAGKEFIHETEDKAKQSKDELSKQISDAKLNITDTAENMKDKIVDAVGETKRAIDDSRKATVDAISSTTRQATGVTNDIIDQIEADIAKTKKSVTDKVKEDTENLKHAVKQGTHTAEDSAKDMMDNTQKDVVKTKDKSKGFFSGIFKDAKHATDEVVDDVKEFIRDTKEDAKHDEEKLSKHVSEKITNVTDAAGTVKKKMVDAAVAGKDGTVDAANATGAAISTTTEQASKAVKDTIKEVADDIEDTKNKAEKEIKKGKDKSKGFFSGIFKGAKHAADEIVDDVKEFIHDTEEEAKHEEEKLSKKISATSESIHDTAKDAKDKLADTVTASKDIVADTGKVTSDKVSNTAELASKKMKDTTKKISEGATVAKDTVAETMKNASESFEEKTKNAAHVVVDSAEAGKDAIEKEMVKTKEKSHEIISAVSAGAQCVAEKISKDSKDLIHEADEGADEKKRQIKDKISANTTAMVDIAVKAKDHVDDTVAATKNDVLDVARTAGEVLSSSAEQVSEATKGTIKKVVDDAVNAKEMATEKVEHDMMQLKQGVKDSTHAVVETSEDTKSRAKKEVAKAKDKTKGFFSGIFKGAKHAADEVVDDVTEFIHDTEKDAEKEREKVEKISAEVIKDTKESIDKSTTQVSEGIVKITDKSEKLKEHVHEKMEKLEEDATGAIKTAGDTSRDAVHDVVHVSQKASEKLGADLSHAKDTTHQEMRDGARIAKEQIEGITDPADAAKDQAKKKIEKSKEKTKGFFSGIFKGGKHSSEEAIDGVSKILDETGRELEKGAEKTYEVSTEVSNFGEETRTKLNAAKDEIVRETSDAITDVSEGKTKMFAEEPQNKAAEEEKLAQNVLKDVAKSVKDIPDKIVIDVHGAKTGIDEKAAEGIQQTKDDFGKHTTDEIIENVKESDRSSADHSISTVEPNSSLKQDKSKQPGFFAGIMKGAKHALEEVTDDVKEFWDEAKEEAEEDEELIKRKSLDATKNLKHELASSDQRVQINADGCLDFKELETVSLKQEKEGKVKTEKQKSSGPIFGILRRDKHEKDDCDKHSTVTQVIEDKMQAVSKSTTSGIEMTAKEVKDDLKPLQEKVIDRSKAVKESIEEAKNQAERDMKKANEKTSNFFSGIMKGAKHAVEDVSGDVREFWDESKQSATEEGKLIQEEVKATGKLLETEKDEASPDSIKRERKIASEVSSPYEGTIPTVADSLLSSQPSEKSTLPVQDIHSATLAFLEDSRETALRTDDRMVSPSIESESLPEEKSSKAKSKGVISSMLKGTKKATEKFWEDTKPEFARESGSYDVSSPQRKADKKSDKVDEAQVTLESFGPIESSTQETKAITKSVSGIPQKIDTAKEFDREIRVVKTERSVERELGDSNRMRGVGHLEPHERETVTTIVTKSSMRTTMSTPPPSPDELGDSRIKDITEEAAKRAQSLADEANQLEKSDISIEESNQKSKIPIRAKEKKEKDRMDEIVTKSKVEDGDQTLVRQSVVTERLEGDNGETSIVTRTVTSIVSESSVSLSQADIDKIMESRTFADPINSITETSTRMITERIPKSTSKEDSGACTSVKETVRSISTKSSWESSSRSHDKDNWDQVQCSLDTSPGSVDIAFTKNGDSRHELPSDSDSDGSPRARRRSLSKRRTLGSSSGSDVALHEGAELSPLEDDQAEENSISLMDSEMKSSPIVTSSKSNRKTKGSSRYICWLSAATAVLVGVVALYLALEPRVLYILPSHNSRQSGI